MGEEGREAETNEVAQVSEWRHFDCWNCNEGIKCPAEWDMSRIRCPFCVELLVPPVIPDGLFKERELFQKALRERLRELLAL